MSAEVQSRSQASRSLLPRASPPLTPKLCPTPISSVAVSRSDFLTGWSQFLTVIQCHFSGPWGGGCQLCAFHMGDTHSCFMWLEMGCLSRNGSMIKNLTC